MNRLLLITLLSAICSAALAQTTPGLPPEQAPAGEPTKFKRPSAKTTTPAATAPAPTPATDAASPTDKKSMTKAQRRAARKEKREEKVGPKPLD